MALENDLGRDDIKKLVWRIAIPSMLAQFVSVLYSIVPVTRTVIVDLSLCGLQVSAVGSSAAVHFWSALLPFETI